MELRSILGKMAPPYSLTPFFTLVLLLEEAHLLEKMAPPYNLASFSSKTSPFYFETLRTREIHIFFYFSQAIIGSSILFSMPPHGIPLRKTCYNLEKGDFF